MKGSNDSVRNALETWQTFVPERPLFAYNAPTQERVFGSAAAAPPIAPLNGGRIHSLQDDAWKSTQKATNRLVKRTVEPAGIPAETVTAAAVAAPTAVKKESVIQVQPLEEVPRRDTDLELFAMEMERRPLRPSQQLILELPPPIETLSYCAQFKTKEMPWFVGGQKTLAANPNLGAPIVPLYPRAYLQPFMREPDHKSSHERPCFNLDREPHEGEQGRVRCIAHRLSEQRLGLGQGYRLRELLNTTQCTQINDALAYRAGKITRDPAQFLPKIPEVCVMCHVWMTTEAALDQKNRAEERRLAQQPPEQVAVLNKFMVDIDKPGEYSRNCLLSGDDIAMGIWGPFPLWNERHYVPWKDPKGTGLRGFQELEDMLFRLSLDPSQQQPSTRMSATAVPLKSLH